MARSLGERTESFRDALLDQLAYLIEEVELLKGIVARVPERLLAGRPLEDALSIKEAYGLLATLDEEVHGPRVAQLAAHEEPGFDPVDRAALARARDWNEQPMPDVLARVQAARRRLVAALRALPPEAWQRTARVGGLRQNLYELMHAVTQHDADLLREMGYRLHESHLTTRPQDLPK